MFQPMNSNCFAAMRPLTRRGASCWRRVAAMGLVLGLWMPLARAGSAPEPTVANDESTSLTEVWSSEASVVYLGRSQMLSFSLGDEASQDISYRVGVAPTGVVEVLRDAEVLAGYRTGFVRVRGLRAGRCTLYVGGAALAVEVREASVMDATVDRTPRIVSPAGDAAVWGRFGVGVRVFDDPQVTGEPSRTVQLRLPDGSLIDPIQEYWIDDRPLDQDRRFHFEVNADQLGTGPAELMAVMSDGSSSLPVVVHPTRANPRTLITAEAESLQGVRYPNRYRNNAEDEQRDYKVEEDEFASAGQFIDFSRNNPPLCIPVEVETAGWYQLILTARGERMPSVGIRLNNANDAIMSSPVLSVDWHRVVVGRPFRLGAGSQTVVAYGENAARFRRLGIDRFELLRLDTLAAESPQGAPPRDWLNGRGALDQDGLVVAAQPIDGRVIHGTLDVLGRVVWRDRDEDPAPRVTLMLNGEPVASQVSRNPRFRVQRGALRGGENTFYLRAASPSGQRADSVPQTVSLADWVNVELENQDAAPEGIAHRFSVMDPRWEDLRRVTRNRQGDDRVAEVRRGGRSVLRLPDDLTGTHEISLRARGDNAEGFPIVRVELIAWPSAPEANDAPAAEGSEDEAPADSGDESMMSGSTMSDGMRSEAAASEEAMSDDSMSDQMSDQMSSEAMSNEMMSSDAMAGEGSMMAEGMSSEMAGAMNDGTDGDASVDERGPGGESAVEEKPEETATATADEPEPVVLLTLEPLEVRGGFYDRPLGTMDLPAGPKAIRIVYERVENRGRDRNLWLESVALMPVNAEAEVDTPPTGEILYPQDGQAIGSADALVFEVNDDRRVIRADLLINGVFHGHRLDERAIGGRSRLVFPLALRHLVTADQSHTLTVRITDSANQATNLPPIQLTQTAGEPTTQYARAVRLLNRLAYGTENDELAAILVDGERAWLERRLGASPSAGDVAARSEALTYGLLESNGYHLQIRMGQYLVRSTNPVRARFVHWLDNHFSTWFRKSQARREWVEHRMFAEMGPAIFQDLLMASAHSPAMIRYLDQNQSRSGRINENYAREILELYACGVDAGYTQEDVTELAHLLTGWTYVDQAPLDHDKYRDHSQFAYHVRLNDQASRDVFGYRFAAAPDPDRRYDRARSAVEMLACRPETARFIATQLARHYVAAAPPSDLVDAMARRFLETGGDLSEVMFAMAEHDAFFADSAPDVEGAVSVATPSVRMAHPVDYAVRLARVSETPSAGPVVSYANRTGHAFFDQDTPDGYADDDEDYANSNHMLQRWHFAKAIQGYLLRLLPGPMMVAPEGDEALRVWQNSVIDLIAIRITGHVLSESSHAAVLEALGEFEGSAYDQSINLVTLIAQMPEANLR